MLEKMIARRSNSQAYQFYFIDITSPKRARRGDGAGTAKCGRELFGARKLPPRCETILGELTIFGLCRVSSHPTL